MLPVRLATLPATFQVVLRDVQGMQEGFNDVRTNQDGHLVVSR